MKKLLSIILAVLMLISSMTCLFTGTVFAEGEAAATEALPENIITGTGAQTVSASAEHPVVYVDYGTWGSSGSKVTTQQFHQFDFKVSVSDDAAGDIRIYTAALSNASVQTNNYYAIVRDVTGGGTEVSVAYPYDNVTGNVDYSYVAYSFVNDCEIFAKGYKDAQTRYEARKEEFPDRDIRLEYPSVAGFDKVANSTLVKAGDKYDYSVVFKPNSQYVTQVAVVVEGLTAGSVTITDPYLMNLTGTQQQNYLYKYGLYDSDIIGILKEEDGNVFTRIIPNRYVAGTAKKAILSSVKGGPLYDLEVLGGSSYRFDADIRFPAGVSQGSNQAPQFDFFETKASNYGKIYESAGDTAEYKLGSTNQETYSESSNAYSYTYIHPTLALKQRRPSPTSVFSTGTYSSKDGSFADIVKTNNTSQNGRELGAQLKDRANVWMDYKYEFTGLAEPLLDSHKRFKSNSSYPNLKYVLNETEDGYVLNENGKSILYPATDTTVGLGIIFYDIIDIDDTSFNEVVPVSVTSKGNGSASVSSATATVGSTVTFTAKSNGGDFLGWYNGETLLSEEATYVHTVTGATNIVAKFTGVKVEWKEKTYLSVKEDLDAAPYKNGPVYRVYDTINYQAAYTVLEGLKPNTRYSFTVYHKGNVLFSNEVGAKVSDPKGGNYTDAEGNKWNTGSNWVVPAASGVENNLQNNTVWANGQYCPGEGYFDNCLKKVINDEFVDADTWQKIEYVFDTNATDTDYILVFKYNGKCEGATGAQICYLSDANVAEYVKVEGPAAAAVEVEETTANSVTLKATEGYEYKVNDGEWQTSNVFEGLEPETEYTFYQRQAEDSFYLAGPASEGVKVKTPAAFTPGNVNDDENDAIDLNDVVALAQIVAGWEGVQHNPAALDIDGNGEVDLNDVVTLAQFVAGWDVEISGGTTGGGDDVIPEPTPSNQVDVDIDVSKFQQ